jgi:hypothetical protein
MTLSIDIIDSNCVNLRVGCDWVEPESPLRPSTGYGADPGSRRAPCVRSSCQATLDLRAATGRMTTLRSPHGFPVLAGDRCNRIRWSGLPVRPTSPAAAPWNAADTLWKDPIRAYSVISTISMKKVHATHLGK